MSQDLRFHVLMLPSGGWGELRARAQRIEELGFEVIAMADHLVDWTNPAAPWFESWTLLAAIAEATSTARLTTLVSQIPLRNPAMLARQALTLDHVSGGRLEIGLGTGLTIDPSYAMAGLPNWSPGERVERFGEYVELVGRLLADEVTTYHGRFYNVDGSVTHPRPVQSPRPPIMVAALGNRMLRHAVRFADIWNSISFLPTFDERVTETSRRIATVDVLCAELGRDPASLRRSYTLFDPQARARGGTLSYYESADRFADEVGRVLELGITDVGVYYPADATQLPMFERIATDVLPALRRG